MLKGIIALDIDGTLTTSSNQISPEIGDYLAKLSAEGWVILFITGRTLTFTSKLFQKFSFPYYVAVQNGASLLKMPDNIILFQFYLTKDVLDKLNLLCKRYHTDFVIASGHENKDIFYYRPQNYSEAMLQYFKNRARDQGENWVPVDTYEEIKLDRYASLKCFGDQSLAKILSDEIGSEIGLDAPVIKDPYDHNYFITQATHPRANKGEALFELAQVLGVKHYLIAAGDDYNDLSMLKRADIKIIIKGAPQELVAMADILAEGPDKLGIIEGLNQAIQRTIR